MVSLSLFVIGALGVWMYTGTGIKTATINQVRAQAIKASSSATEPLVYNTRPDCLSAALTTVYPRTVTADDGKDSYVVSFVNAVDGKGTVIANSDGAGGATILVASTSWSSPITVTLSIPYQGMVDVVTAYQSYSLILQNYSVGCDA